MKHNNPLSRRFPMTCAALLTGIMTLFCSACGNISAVNAAESTGPTITIGIENDLPGLSLQQGNQYSGFAVDVAEYVADQLGYAPKEIIWKNVPIADRATMLNDDAVDMIVGPYAISNTHKQNVDFAGPYVSTGLKLLVNKTNTSITGPQSLAGKTICTAAGTVAAQEITKNFGTTVHLIQYPTYAQCVTALLSGTVDAVAADGIILAGLNSTKGDGYLKIVGQPFTKDYYGIAVKKNSPGLVYQINQALKKMVSTGTWKRDFNTALANTGYTMNTAWNLPTTSDAQISQETDSSTSQQE